MAAWGGPEALAILAGRNAQHPAERARRTRA